MAYNPLADVDISLATATTERVGFGVPIFITSHRAWSERVRVYSNLTSVANDFDTGSNAYKAAQSAFGQGNGLSTLLIGRRDADLVLSCVAPPQQNESWSFNIEVNDGDALTVTYTEAGASPTQESVLTAIAAIIDGDADIAAHVSTTVSGTGSAATLTISPLTSSDFFIVENVENLDESYTGTETAADVYQKVKLENDGFYAVTADDKSETFVLALAAAVNADNKQYWVSTAQQSSLTVLTQPATDILGKLAENEYARTQGMYHQDAETTFPEIVILGYNLPYLAGSIVWGNDVTSGVAASADENGVRLDDTQKTNLLARNAAFWDRQGGRTFFNSDVKTANGSRPEDIRGRDSMQADMVSQLRDFLLSQNGKKVPYTDTGIGQVKSQVQQILELYYQRGFILSNYQITVPKASSILVGKKASQIFDELTFVAQLTGAITMVDIRGTLQLEEIVA